VLLFIITCAVDLYAVYHRNNENNDNLYKCVLIKAPNRQLCGCVRYARNCRQIFGV